ncbi:MAG: hypothetical protein M1830_006054 [Pleopsidium flavum]|nr:MAG: hypothetical protein M1830_006081 [Pleopsidium flavum]KAI9876632.1 MAG: hypothetical protein M1830_006054 [Pleopsidium flavum]
MAVKPEGTPYAAMVTQQRSEDIHEISLEPYHSTTTGDGNPDPGLTQTPTTPADAEDNLDYMTKTQAWNLYTTHMLSTWNARTYEFAAILFTASAYPDTLLASSIRYFCSVQSLDAEQQLKAK